LLLGVICSLGGTVLALASWFALSLVLALRVSVPGLEPADPGPVWAIVSMGCVLFVTAFFSAREYGTERYRSTVGILSAGITGLLFIILSFVAFHGWAVQGFKTAG
jgi:hypothetical protein